MDSPPTILVVDDDHDTVTGLKGVLENDGYMVQVAHNGEDAIKIERDHDIALLMLDYVMPGLDGAETYKK